MRLVSKSGLRAAAVAAGAALLVVAAAGTVSLLAGDDDDDAGPTAEQIKAAQESMDKAIARGKEMWSSTDRFKKPCSKCHDAADKPQLDLATRAYSYPAWSKRKKGIVTMHQKIQEMIQFNSRGAVLDDKGTEIADLDAYVMSLRKKK